MVQHLAFATHRGIGFSLCALRGTGLTSGQDLSVWSLRVPHARFVSVGLLPFCLCVRGTGLSAVVRLSLRAFAFVGAGLTPARRREAPSTRRIRQSAKLLKEIAFA